MTDEQLIGYCDLHCESERALFSGEQINRMLALAGFPKGFAKAVPAQSWISVHDDMKTLCEMARMRMRQPPALAEAPVCQVIAFPCRGRKD